MLRGDFSAAWAVSDAILAHRDPCSRDDPARPYHERWVWDGRDLAGRRVVVRCYHGLGDTLQFVRFLPALHARAGHVTLEVQPELASLLAAVPGVDEIVPFDVGAPIPADSAIEIMELQHALRALPDPVPYLFAEPMPGFAAATGVVWQAGRWDPERSVPFDELRPILPSGCVSLQRGADGLPDPLHGSMDVLDTARLIAGLRRVITVDTMVAHLAGALGRPVHLLLKAHADWRWGLGTQSSWYRNTTIHRQHRPGDWRAALASLDGALRAEG
jgi:hypothetical protein